MNTVTIDGEIYTKISDLAERFGYTTDYIGQLCRAKKIDAQLVGRSWYVNEFSLQNHKDSRYEVLRGNEIISKSKVNLTSREKTTRVAETVTVRPSLSKKTQRAISSISDAEQPNRITHIDRFPLAHYEHDEGILVPQIKQQSTSNTPTSAPDILPDVTKLSIKNNKENPYKIVVSDVTETTMSGHINIDDVLGKKNQADIVVPAPSERVLVSTKNRSTILPVTRYDDQVFLEHAPATTKHNSTFIPARMLSAPTKHSSTSFSLVISAFLIAIFVVFILLTVDTQIVSNGVEFDHRLVFNMTSCLQIFSRLRF